MKTEMTLLEIVQFCALHGISLMFRAAPEEADAPGVFPNGEPSVAAALNLPDAVELVFTARTDVGRAAWHLLLMGEMARDPAAFEEALREGFHTFCRHVGIEPRPPQRVWGLPVVRMTATDSASGDALRLMRELPERRLCMGVDWAKKDGDKTEK